MSIHLLGLLDGEVAVRPWLERQLTGPDLLDVVRELTALHGAGDGRPSFLEARRAAILEQGLTGLSDEEIETLFRNPSSLPRLQELVLQDGGPYWDGVLSGAASHSLPTPSPRPPVRRARPRYLRTTSLVTHLAAAAAAALLVWLLAGTRPPPATPRGEPQLTEAASADAVLPTVAEQIDRKWSAVRRQADADAALREMEQTCEQLALAPLPQLSEPARATLRHDLAQLTQLIESQRITLEKGGDSLRARAVVECRVNTLISTRWRNPGDLPDSAADPDDLPPASITE